MAGTVYDAVMQAFDAQEARQNNRQDRKQTLMERERQNNAFNALIGQYGAQAALPDQTATLGANARAQQTQDTTVAADLRTRQNAAQRAGIGLARQIVNLPPDQQDAAMQQVAPHIAQAFGTTPDQVINTLNTVRQLPPDQREAMLNQLDQSLMTPEERNQEANRQTQVDIATQNNQRATEVANIGATSRENVAATRASQTNQTSEGALTAAAAIADQAISNLDANITPYVNQHLNEGSAGAMGREALAFINPGEARSFRANVESLKNSLSLNDLRNMRATGLRLGNTTMKEFIGASTALAALDTNQRMDFLRVQVQRARAALVAFRDALRADIAAQQAGRQPPGGYAPGFAPEENQPDATATPDQSTAPAADDVSSFFGVQ